MKSLSRDKIDWIGLAGAGIVPWEIAEHLDQGQFSRAMWRLWEKVRKDCLHRDLPSLLERWGM